MNAPCEECYQKTGTKAIYVNHGSEYRPSTMSICKPCCQEFADMTTSDNRLFYTARRHPQKSAKEFGLAWMRDDDFVKSIEIDDITSQMLKDWNKTDYYWRAKK